MQSRNKTDMSKNEPLFKKIKLFEKRSMEIC